MPRTKPSSVDTTNWSDSDWMEFGPVLEPLPAGIDEAAADAIYDFEADDAFLAPIQELADEIGNLFFATFADFDKVEQWFVQQVQLSVPQERLDHMYGLYVGQMIMHTFGKLTVGWTLDPRQDQPTYLKPVIGPFGTSKPMRYFNPFDYVVEDWLNDLPMNAHDAVREVDGWISEFVEANFSSPLERHFYRKMHNLLPEF